MEAPNAKAKVVVIGDTGVGKRSLVRRSAFDPYADRYLESFGAKVSKKEILLPVRLRDGTVLDLILLTIRAGALKGRGRTFAARAVGIFAVCDATAATAWPTWRTSFGSSSPFRARSRWSSP